MGMKNMMAASSWGKGMLSVSESRAFFIFISSFTQILALLSSILHTAVMYLFLMDHMRINEDLCMLQRAS